ncbi:E3 ubiquitin-protein ligase rnf213-beta [Menidia menidia]
MKYEDDSRPPPIQAGRLVSEALLRILSCPDQQLPAGFRGAGALIRGFSVLRAAVACHADLGAAGWARTARIVSGGADPSSLEALGGALEHPQSDVLALMNVCCRLSLVELVLLPPLLFWLRPPGGGAGALGPQVEEGAWAGLGGVQYQAFRETAPRGGTLALVRQQLALAADRPRLPLAWLALGGLQDLPQLSDLLAPPAEQLIQALMFRLREAGGAADPHRAQEAAELAERSLSHVLLKVEAQEDRLMASGNLDPALRSSLSLLGGACLAARTVPCHPPVVRALQLSLKLAGMLQAKLSRESKEEELQPVKQKLLEKMLSVLKKVSEWRDNLLQKPLLGATGLSYPKEIQLWDGLLGVACCWEELSSCWTQSLQTQLTRRISQEKDGDQVLLCCLERPAVAMATGHALLRSCFQRRCHAAIRAVCQRGHDGGLLRRLRSKVGALPAEVTSAMVVESAARFHGNEVAQLLDPESSVSVLLTDCEWSSIQLEDAAAQVLHGCLEAVHALVASLLGGQVTLAHLQTCLGQPDAFRSLYLQYWRSQREKPPLDAQVLLAAREKELNAFWERRRQVDTLIKMMAKVADSLAVPEMAALEERHSVAPLAVPLSQLVQVRPPPRRGAAPPPPPRRSSGRPPPPVHATLAHVHELVWTPLMCEFRRTGAAVAAASGGGAGGSWVQPRMRQIQDYRRLLEAAAAAGAVLNVARTMKLSGDFTEIEALGELNEASFKRRELGSLGGGLLEAGHRLSGVSPQQTACLEAFAASRSLVAWVRKQLGDMSEVKVYVELASISAGENDAEIDQVACFHDALMGYAPLIYALHPGAGFPAFMTCAGQVWDALSRDEKLPDKLTESTRLLGWLMELKETHGSVEQSSLSLASSINAHGVYRVGWSEGSPGRRCLQNMVQVSVNTGREEKTYRLEELLELQNKLMLMSSKGENSREQVSRFTEVFEGVQRVAAILLQMQTSGNMLFRDWRAEVRSDPRGGQQPSVSAEFCSLGGGPPAPASGLPRGGGGAAGPAGQRHGALPRRLVLLPGPRALRLRPAEPVRRGAAAVPEPRRAPRLRAAGATATATAAALGPAGAREDGVQHGRRQGRLRTGRRRGRRGGGGGGGRGAGRRAGRQEEDDEEELEDLWRSFRTRMSEHLRGSLDLLTLGRFLHRLSEMNPLRIVRKLPPLLQEGRPNLVLCPQAEVFSTGLWAYAESPEQPLPSADEVLVCREETTVEEVEIFLRRALGQGSRDRIHSLLSPGLLGYEASEALLELFEGLEGGADPRYRLLIVSPVEHQYRSVPAYFSSSKVQAGPGLTQEAASRYLLHHFRQRSPTLASPDRLSVWMVSSTRPAVGKSLYVERLFERCLQSCPGVQHVRIRLIESCVDLDALVGTLTQKLSPLREQDPVLLHIDTAGVLRGLEELLFRLLVLGCLSDSHGVLWRRNPAHLVTVEVLRTDAAPHSQPKEVRTGLLDILPTIRCRPPSEVRQLLASRRLLTERSSDPLMDEQEFCSEGIQRPYQYLKLYSQNSSLDRFSYRAGSSAGDPAECLRLFLTYCGMEDPSWGELKSFSWFLNVQLKDCESSVFCDPDFLADQLPGFKGFIVKFMILMARDFASPSLNPSDQSPAPERGGGGPAEDDLLLRLTIRKRWENQPHPYIFFNADRFSMSFLGFNVQRDGRRNALNAVDPQSQRVLIQQVMSPELFEGLERQSISLTEDFDQLPRAAKIKRISCVVGAQRGMTDGDFDPDPSYELTADNVTKMLAIHMRFRCGIPVVVMGETGCGKTRLVRFLCALQRERRPVENMVLVKVHGGTGAEAVYRKVREAEALALENRRRHELDTILFFDEANTTEAIFAIKEVLCDGTVKGDPLRPMSGLKIIAACNPYRRHSAEMVERLERAGLGYRVRAQETEDRLGKVPLRQLVYRVQPLPPSLAPLVWDFGQLSDPTELSYIEQIVRKKVADHGLPEACEGVVSKVLAASQKYMRSRRNECSFVSLRDVERSMKVLVWFYQHSQDLFSSSAQLNENLKTLKCLALAVGVCYYPSLVTKEGYLAEICGHFPSPLNSAAALREEISSCQDLFLQNIKTRETIAKNAALKENVFLMVVCIELRIPLFLVGKPGSSKSLAKTVVADAMQGQNSHCRLFRRLKQVHMVSFQCSPHSSPEGIIATFRNCARFQKDKNTEEYVSVVVLDEIGLAEDSPQMPLKTLHPLLEDGCIDNDKPDPHMKVGFVGISNWALDPAKMNRGIFVSRWDPSEDELVETAKGICSSSQQILLKISHLFPPLAKAFLRICEHTAKNQFFGLRDYYSLVKMLFAAVKATQQEPDGQQLLEAVLRNFSGQPEGFDPVGFFQEVLQDLLDIPRPSTLEMVRKNLGHGSGEESRYLLLLTTNNAALHILQQQVFGRGHQPPPEIVFGSGFPKDQEYAQICRNVNRVKTCMETGRTVVLLNMQNLYESLYDALNQYYVYLSRQQYVDLGLGSHRVKCRVHTSFRLVVVEDQKKVYEHFPVPLINRLEKHRVDRSTDLQPWQHRVLHRLREWVESFSGGAREDFGLSDIFIGFHGDACASALLQALEKREQKLRDKPGALDSDEQKRVAEVEHGRLFQAEGMEPEEETLGKSGDAGKKEEVDQEEEVDPGDGPLFARKDEEEEVLDLAKALLLNCATPDAVMRLKSSDLSNQEKETLQRLYFRQQQHQSLPGFLGGRLRGRGGPGGFLEITTFSSLLTRSDVRVVAHSVGLPTERILLLSLHQFDTETSFCNKIRGFLRVSGGWRLLVIQMDLEESQCSEELLASAKFCTMNCASAPEAQACWVVFIVKASRIPGLSRYIGFQGGVWLSVHIDDLRESEDMSLDLSLFCGTLISSLLKPAQTVGKDECEEGMSTAENPEERNASGARLRGLSLVRSCVHKAVGLLRGPGDVAPRSLQRISLLLPLLEPDPEEGLAARFQDLLLGRLAEALGQREESMAAPGEWAESEARRRHALQEGGTLRHTLWLRLQAAVTPVLAAMLEVLDRYGNLDLLRGAGPNGGRGRGRGQGLVRLWMDILADPQILQLNPLQSPSGPDQEVLVQHVLRLDGEERPCSAPFGWLIRAQLDALWEESEFLPGTQGGGSERILRFVGSFCSSRLGAGIRRLPREERREFGHRFLHDFLLLAFKIKTEDELRVFSRAVRGCVWELQASVGGSHGDGDGDGDGGSHGDGGDGGGSHGDGAPLCPAWIAAAAKHRAARLDALGQVLLLQPELASDLLKQASGGGGPGDGVSSCLPDVEDVLALGLALERLRLLEATSVPGCRVLGGRLQLLQPCLDAALGQRYAALCSATCRQQLDAIRSLWDGMLLASSFIQSVVLGVGPEGSRLSQLALRHLNLLLNLVQEAPDVRSVETLRRLIRILNSFHSECISQELRAALEDLEAVRRCCNAFFLEAVSRFWLSGGRAPEGGVVELLFSLMVCAAGGVYRTRELSPFLECVDNSPVVRSVLPKLLLQHSFEQVQLHLQAYLQELEKHFLDPEDLTELYLLFVNCFQDALLTSRVRGGADGGADGGAEACFLGRVARGQTPGRLEAPAQFLLCRARLKLCLSSAAGLLEEASRSGLLEEAARPGGGGGAGVGLLVQVRAVCEYGGNDWTRVYLLRALHHHSGTRGLLDLMERPRWSWIFPPELLRLQRLVPTSVDPFLSCGEAYLSTRGAVAQVLLENSGQNFLEQLQKLKGSEMSLVALAVFRQVSLRYRAADSSLHPSTQEIARLEALLRGIPSPGLRAFCCSLLANRIGGRGSSLQVSGDLPAQRQTVLELLVHLDSVLLTGNSNALLRPLHQIAFQPENASSFFLPTMPDDHSSEARRWLGTENLHQYKCANGHVCFVGECGRPMVRSQCPDCGVPIGGERHVPVQGFSRHTEQRDQTRAGHLLGAAAQRPEAPERQLTPSESAVLRLLTHLALLQGAATHQRSVEEAVHPRPVDLLGFLWKHLEKDLAVLAGTLGQNREDAAVVIHLILSGFPTGSPGADLTSREGRRRWEELVCNAAIRPVLTDVRPRLDAARRRIGADGVGPDGVGPLTTLLFGDPGRMLFLPAACPTDRSASWRPRHTLTVERFSQRVAERPGRVPLLSLFTRKVHCVRRLHLLPELASLQADLLRAFPAQVAPPPRTIAQMLRQVPEGYQRKTLTERVERFLSTWNCLRAEVANSSADLVGLCEDQLSVDSSGEYLTVSRRGPGSCLRILVDFLSETHNSLVREARRLNGQEDSEHSVPLERLSETQLALCDPESQLLPLVWAACSYTLQKGGETGHSLDLPAIQAQLARRFLAGKPLIQADASRLLNRQLQDFSVVLTEVREKIRQEPLKGSAQGAARASLRCYADVCDAVAVVEVGLRFLGKTGGDPRAQLLSYLADALQMRPQISSAVAKGLGDSRLENSNFTWQLLTCWKSELMLSRKQDPFQTLAPGFQQKLSPEDRRGLKAFLALTDVDAFALELHEILLLKASRAGPDQEYQPHWDIRSTLEVHLEQKELPPLLELEAFPEQITLGQGADAWRTAVEFKRR